MRNPVKMIAHAWRVWSSLDKRYPGVFTAADAWRQFYRVWAPARFPYRAAGKALARMTEVDEMEPDRFRVHVPEREISFYWPGPPKPNLYYTLEQEFDFRNPHFYTTRPIRLGHDSRILDVGACEGLFALRTAKAGDAAKVYCFEPDSHMARLIELSALENDVPNVIQVMNEAVARESGEVSFTNDGSPEGGRLVADGGTKIPATSIDDFCARRKLDLNQQDLIKIDAEGADLDVLKGAEACIRQAAPQIAVTTYHTDDHCHEIIDYLRSLQPGYRLRLKGFSFWTPVPRPVLLQAAVPE